MVPLLCLSQFGLFLQRQQCQCVLVHKRAHCAQFHKNLFIFLSNPGFVFFIFEQIGYVIPSSSAGKKLLKVVFIGL